MKLLNVIGFALLLLTTACSGPSGKSAKGGKSYGGVLNYTEKNALISLNTHLIDDESSARIAAQVFESLVKLNPKDLTIIPSIAESFEFDEDKLTYTFKLKNNVFFHDNSCFKDGKGRKVNADDVIFTFERICKKQLINATYINTFKDIVLGAKEFHNNELPTIKGLKKIDDHTVSIQLRQSNNSFIKKLAGINCAIVPKEGITKYKDNNKIGTGAFTVSSFVEGESVTLTANPNYHAEDKLGNKLPFLNSVQIDFNSRIKEQVANFFGGDQNIILNVPIKAVKSIVKKHIKSFKEDSLSKLHSGDLLSTYYIEFNRSNKHLANPNFRKAISYAINRKSICENLFGMSVSHAGNKGITHPGLKGYKTKRIKGYDFNPELAKAFLDSCHFEDSLITLNIDVSENDYKAQQIINELEIQLDQTLGVKLILNIFPNAYKSARARFGKGDLYVNSYLAQYPSPESFLSNFYSESVPKDSTLPSYPNTARYVNQEFDHMFKKGRKSINQEDSYRNFSIAERRLMDDAPIVVLWYEEVNSLLEAQVQDFPQNSIMYFDLSTVYLKNNKVVRDSLQVN